MMLRLIELLGPDTKSRWRAIFASAAGIAIWGFISELRGDPVHEAQINATVFGALIFLLQVLVYCIHPVKAHAEGEQVVTVPRRLIATAAAAIVLAAIPAPAVEAAILDRRLRTLTRGGNLSPQQAEEVGSLLSMAAKAPMKLGEGTRAQVYLAVKKSGLQHPDSQPIVSAASEFVRYTREMGFAPALDAKAAAEARAAYRRGANYAMTVLSGPPTVPTSDRQDATKAIAEFTRAIELSAGLDRDVLIQAMTMRATMYLWLVEPSAALTDAERLESIGGPDLSDILAIEGTALFMRGGRDDLERAILLFTLLIEVPPPTWTSPDPKSAILFRIDAFGNRGRAYYKIGKFENCIQDSERMLNLLFESQRTPGMPFENGHFMYYLKLAYLSIIASYLQLGNVESASTEADAWLEKSGGDPAAIAVAGDLKSGRFDRQRWLKEYMRPAM